MDNGKIKPKVKNFDMFNIPCTRRPLLEIPSLVKPQCLYYKKCFMDELAASLVALECTEEEVTEQTMKEIEKLALTKYYLFGKPNKAIFNKTVIGNSNRFDENENLSLKLPATPLSIKPEIIALIKDVHTTKSETDRIVGSLKVQLGPSDDSGKIKKSLRLKEVLELIDQFSGQVYTRAAEKFLQNCLRSKSIGLTEVKNGFFYNLEDTLMLELPHRQENVLQLIPGFKFSSLCDNEEQSQQGPQEVLTFSLQLTYQILHLETFYHYLHRLESKTIPAYWESIVNQLNGICLMHSPNRRIYKLKSIELAFNPWLKICIDNTEISIADYYRKYFFNTSDHEHSKYAIFDMSQPLLKCCAFEREGSDNDIFLLPQFCHQLGKPKICFPENYLFWREAALLRRLAQENCSWKLQQFLVAFMADKKIEEDFDYWGFKMHKPCARANIHFN